MDSNEIREEFVNAIPKGKEIAILQGGLKLLNGKILYLLDANYKVINGQGESCTRIIKEYNNKESYSFIVCGEFEDVFGNRKYIGAYSYFRKEEDLKNILNDFLFKRTKVYPQNLETLVLEEIGTIRKDIDSVNLLNFLLYRSVGLLNFGAGGSARKTYNVTILSINPIGLESEKIVEFVKDNDIELLYYAYCKLDKICRIIIPTVALFHEGMHTVNLELIYNEIDNANYEEVIKTNVIDELLSYIFGYYFGYKYLMKVSDLEKSKSHILNCIHCYFREGLKHFDKVYNKDETLKVESFLEQGKQILVSYIEEIPKIASYPNEKIDKAFEELTIKTYNKIKDLARKWEISREIQLYDNVFKQ